MRRNATLAVVVASLAVTAGIGWRFDAAAQHGTNVAKRPEAPTKLMVDAGALHAAVPAPPSLAGTTAPRLPLDAHGRLAKTHAVRDFFDYFLTTQHEVPNEALDAMVRAGVAAQLEGSAAQAEALEVWQRYRAYRDALAHATVLQGGHDDSANANSSNLDAVRSAFDVRASIASRTLGAPWSEAFFGNEWRQTGYALARLRIMGDNALDDAQKVARLRALIETLPPDERATLDRQAKTQSTLTTIAALQQQDVPSDQLRSRASAALGADVAERVVQMRGEDDAWRARYAAYAAQRASVDAQGLAPAEREARLAQLRKQTFEDPSERLRAATLDAGPAD
ncbi:lipase chaperone [Trinickia sp. LjRoot230]|uniref:lipase secretion chaperone n=1 Tax=Trinickia sp. LjRoot230 TaxID=3342288 RepID=UPI003ECFB236